MINIENEYIGLLSGVYHGGKPKEDRTGIGTRSVFGRMIRHDMAAGFPILTTKKIYFEKALTEILWILNGRTDLQYLHDNGVNYWDHNYKQSGRTDGTLGPVYGAQWRNFNGVDQLKELLISVKNNPNSRRHMVSAWNPAAIPDMALPPCHYGFQININNGVIDLMWQQRSVDVFLGLPYDIVMYGLVLEMLAKGLNLKAGQLIGSLGDCHIYNNHTDAVQRQLKNKPYKLPKVNIQFGIDLVEGANNHLRIPTHNMVELINYKHHGPIKAALN